MMRRTCEANLSFPACGGGVARAKRVRRRGERWHIPLPARRCAAIHLPRKQGRMVTHILPLMLLAFLAACSRKEPHGWLGYAEGDNALISAPQPGWLAHLAVERGDQVKPGQLLFTLDEPQQAAARDQAAAAIPQIKAQIAQANANLDLTRKNLERQQGLARAHAGVPSTLDQAQASYRQAVDSLSQLQAQ